MLRSVLPPGRRTQYVTHTHVSVAIGTDPRGAVDVIGYVQTVLYRVVYSVPQLIRKQNLNFDTKLMPYTYIHIRRLQARCVFLSTFSQLVTGFDNYMLLKVYILSLYALLYAAINS